MPAVVRRGDPDEVASVGGGQQVEVRVGRFRVDQETGDRSGGTAEFDRLVAVLFPLPRRLGDGAGGGGGLDQPDFQSTSDASM